MEHIDNPEIKLPFEDAIKETEVYRNYHNTESNNTDNITNPVNPESFTMDDVMAATFGESSQTIRATFKKTCLIRQYETEVIELESTLQVDRQLSGVERMFISAMLKAQLEYEAYIGLLAKSSVGQVEFKQRKQSLETEINSIKIKVESIIGKDRVHELMGLINTKS